ncbi:MAG: hypothetical protein GYB68_13600 [Chloroflexi bacterium]|nr:hypothetical protein [Chloroflexota bacterium]
MFNPSFQVAQSLSNHSISPSWVDLVEHLRERSASDPQMMAFTLTMRRLRRDLELDRRLVHDPFCQHCAAEIVSHYPGSEQDLINLYFRNLNEIERGLRNMPVHRNHSRIAAA